MIKKLIIIFILSVIGLIATFYIRPFYTLFRIHKLLPIPSGDYQTNYNTMTVGETGQIWVVTLESSNKNHIKNAYNYYYNYFGTRFNIRKEKTYPLVNQYFNVFCGSDKGFNDIMVNLDPENPQILKLYFYNPNNCGFN